MKNNPIFFNYNVTNSGERLDVFIDGTIVDAETQEIWKEWFNDDTSVSFKSFRTEIIDSGLKNIRITINSFGGQIGDAMAMHDFIKQLENDGYAIETIGLGMICSAATYVLSAAKNSKISPNSWYMIHNVSGFAWGDVNEVEKYAKNLRRFNNNIRDFYVNLTGKTANQVSEWMDAETWFTGKEAVDNGFVAQTTDQKEEFKPINSANWNFKNTNALNAFNSIANAKPPVINLDNLNENDMSKLSEAIVNAFKALNLVPNEKGDKPEALTVENLTNALNTALKDFDPEPKAPTDEQVTTAITNFFKNGLPENMISQITNVVKENATTENFTETEDFKKLDERIGEIENSVAKNLGQAKPENSGKSGNVTDKYEHEDIGWK
ncbi:Clp protease ClpP [Chryseobacterium gambrini]|uniref:Clp protease ClpP n=1 Tax=Chryseobacterium gambrini TaxID=373672 RepID=UPI003D0F3155